MILKLVTGINEAGVKRVMARITKLKLKPHPVKGAEQVIIGVIGANAVRHRAAFESLEEVEEVVAISKPYKLVSRELHPENTVFRVGNVRIGGPEIAVIAGPCSVDTRVRLEDTAEAVRKYRKSVAGGEDTAELDKVEDMD